MRGGGNPGLRTGMKLLIRDGHPTALATLQRLEAIYGPIERAKLAAGTRRPWFRVHRGSGRQASLARQRAPVTAPGDSEPTGI
jgi:hypothetical protein